jgi:hypothetical protein
MLLLKTEQWAKAVAEMVRVLPVADIYVKNPATWYNGDCFLEDSKTWKPKLRTKTPDQIKSDQAGQQWGDTPGE